MYKKILCQFCEKEMEPGVIYCDRYALKWVSSREDKGIPSTFKGIKLTNFIDKPYVDAYMCKNCKKVLIDFNETV